MAEIHNRSVPLHLAAPPREPTAAERAALVRIADVLMPASAALPAPSAVAGFAGALDRALAARADAFDAVIAFATELATTPDAGLEDALRRASVDDAGRFHAASSVLAGAYLILPEIRRLIGYPGQERRPAPFDQIADELGDGILDPVIERGSIYTPAPD